MGKGERTRQTVLAEATEIAARHGLSGLTIGTLASSAGMSKSGLYAHFGSKEALQLAILDHARDFFIDQVVRPALRAPRGEPRVRALFEHWLTCCRDRMPAGCVYMASKPEFGDRPGPVRDRLVRDQLDLYDMIGQVFRTGIGEGHFRPEADPAQFAQDLEGVLTAFFFAHRLLRDPAVEARARRAFETLLTTVRRSD